MLHGWSIWFYNCCTQGYWKGLPRKMSWVRIPSSSKGLGCLRVLKQQKEGLMLPKYGDKDEQWVLSWSTIVIYIVYATWAALKTLDKDQLQITDKIPMQFQYSSFVLLSFSTTNWSCLCTHILSLLCLHWKEWHATLLHSFEPQWYQGIETQAQQNVTVLCTELLPPPGTRTKSSGYQQTWRKMSCRFSRGLISH